MDAILADNVVVIEVNDGVADIEWRAVSITVIIKDHDSEGARIAFLSVKVDNVSG